MYRIENTIENIYIYKIHAAQVRTILFHSSCCATYMLCYTHMQYIVQHINCYTLSNIQVM